MQQTLLIDLHFCPSLEYFCALQPYADIRLEKKEHYVKQSYRNRCYVKTTHGIEMLSVPLTGKHGKVAYDEVLIDYSTRWQNIFWRTIESAYRNSPYFEHYSDDFRTILYSGTEKIFELNLRILSFCLDCLNRNAKVSVTNEYEKVAPELVSDMRGRITTRNTYRDRHFYRPFPYYQVFGNSFEENLTVLDLLFCTGPQAGKVLQLSSEKVGG